MKISEAWLRERVNIDVSQDTLLEQLTMLGLEVDGTETVAAEFSGVVVGEVVALEKHPDADRLKLCQVNVGASENLSIICGASNVAKNMRVAVAQIGASLPGIKKLKKAKLKGIESFGMLCSASELGLEEKSDGIMVLPKDIELGKDINEVLNTNDIIIDISLTPNRGDCLSAQGIAREIAVINETEFKPVSIDIVKDSHKDTIPVTLANAQACPRYVGRVIKGINQSATTPLWMIEKLRRSGVRAIHPIVDITNYVMLELGQPMHGFDLAKIDSEIIVRNAIQGEKFVLLDESECELNENTLVIADKSKPLAMAGIMGGLDSSVTETTQDILLESAYFAPLAITGRAREYGLHTDSSHRFERGVDPELQKQAIELASVLIIEICGGEAGSVFEACEQDQLPKRLPVTLRHSEINNRIGIEVEKDKVVSIFEQLGCGVSGSESEYTVSPPSYRFDMEIEADLVEEIARIVSYDNIATKPLNADLLMRVNKSQRHIRQKITDSLVASGYFEAITFSFVDPELDTLFSQTSEKMQLSNPIAPELACMRTSLLPGLIKAAQYNLQRQQNRVRLFESGRVFQGQDNLQQNWHLGVIMVGNLQPNQWDTSSKVGDFFDIKNDITLALSSIGNLSGISFKETDVSYLHPGESAELILQGESIGSIGCIHPKLAKQLNLNEKTYLLDINTDKIKLDEQLSYKELSRFPAVKRDISIVLDTQIAAADVAGIIKSKATKDMQNLELFDVYDGEGIEKGKKSLSFSLTFQRSSSTLIDEEVDEVMLGVLTEIKDKFGGTLRD